MTDKAKPVRSCVCAGVTFAEMWQAGVRSVDDARSMFCAGCNCGVCVPYLRLMVETGETEFEILDPLEIGD